MTDLEGLRRNTERLREAAEGFCSAFVAGEPPPNILDKFFTRNAKILEHGPSWARRRLPFLGQTFQGRKAGSGNDDALTCDRYYEILTSILSFHPLENTVPPKEDFMIDGLKGTVTVKLHAEFSSIKTGKRWEEDFVYVLSEFDDEGKIGSQELWADPLSAWMAVQSD